ncbi:hypothetical protein [Azospirillum ramasamyi]|nr:hypothetical protein [Azospirillum ramasamyi]
MKDALACCAERRRVAFGSQGDWMRFGNVEAEYGLKGMPVFIYVSDPQADPDGMRDPVYGRVSYRAVLVRTVGAVGGVHPDATVRPKSCVTQDTPTAHFFWEVTGLELIPEAERRLVTQFTALGRSKPLPSLSALRGPMFVRATFIGDYRLVPDAVLA